MREKTLECCVVRDLLPSYVEHLTEPQTADLVREHLDQCPDCRKIEQDMHRTVPVEKAPEHELKFLKRIKRTRLMAAVLSGILALWCMWWLYDQAFHYPNTEAGRLEAVEDYVPGSRVPEGTPLQVAAWETEGNHLFLFYFTEHDQNIHGVVHLVRGLNGKYRTLEAEIDPSQYSGGLYGEELSPKGTDWKLFYLAGYNCRDIYRAEVEFLYVDHVQNSTETVARSLDLTGENFLQFWGWDELEELLGFAPDREASIYLQEIRLFDKEGEDITAQYQNERISSWGGGAGTAETFLVYVYMGIVAGLGVIFIRYFLRRD